MPCYHPLKAIRTSDGLVRPTRKVDQYDELEITPDPSDLVLPCGQCIGCRMRRSREWALRAIHESRLHDRASFVTLTYDDERMPDDWDHSLDKGELQRFLKRVRYHHGKFRYIAAGEYGPKTNRPHYHLLMYGLDWMDDAIPHPHKPDLWLSSSLALRWKHGIHSVGAVTPESAGYVAQYTLKKALGAQKRAATERLDPDTGEFWTVEPEFFLMSRHPGIGHDWFAKYRSDCYPDDFLIDHNGKKAPIPKYYDVLAEREDYERFLPAKAAREDRTPPSWFALKAQEKTVKSRRRLFGASRREL